MLFTANCLKTFKGTTDACQADSGGPMACNSKLCGVVSFGDGCAKPGYPGVYVNVPHYRRWIHDNAAFDDDTDVDDGFF